MPVFNREQHLPNAKNIIGSFLDIFPVRIQTSPQEPIVSIARKIEQFVRTMLEYPISSIELSRKIAEQEGLKQSSLSAIIFSNSINMLPKGISHSSRYLTIGAPKVQTGAPGTYIDLVMYTWEINGVLIGIMFVSYLMRNTYNYFLNNSRLCLTNW